MPFIIQWEKNSSGKEIIERVQTPAGQLTVYRRQDVIIKTDWESDFYGLPGDIIKAATSFRAPRSVNDECGLEQGSADQILNRYWQNHDSLINVQLLRQGSAYRNRVWSALSEIPFGETMTYSALARKIGSSARAVGNACRDNPYALFIPCHRVVSASGLGGYCGQTDGEKIAIKYKLLEFEASHKQ